METTATPANGEVHYFDQAQVVPGGTLPAWAPGFLATSGVVIERAIASGEPRNLATRQLYGGGDETRDASGFHTAGPRRAVTFDMLDRVRGMGSIRWDVEDAASKLYFGWPATGALEDPAPPTRSPPCPAGPIPSVSGCARRRSSSSQLTFQAINAAGNTVGAATNGGPITLGTTWTRYTATITAPANTVYVRPQLDNTAW